MSSIIKKCHNCLFDVSMIDLTKINNKCPRCFCGLIDKFEKEKYINQPETGDNSPDVRGKPLAS